MFCGNNIFPLVLLYYYSTTTLFDLDVARKHVGGELFLFFVSSSLLINDVLKEIPIHSYLLINAIFFFNNSKIISHIGISFRRKLLSFNNIILNTENNIEKN